MAYIELLWSRRGLVAVFSGTFSLTISDMLVYASGQVFHPLVIVVWNSAVLSLLSFGCIFIKKSAVSEPHLMEKLLLLGLTGILKGCADVALTCANIYSTPGNAIAILYTMPIFTILFSVTFLGDKCRYTDAVLAVLAIAGVLLISKPDFVSTMFGESDQSDVLNPEKSPYYLLGVVLALCSSAMNGAALVVGRYVGDYEVSPLFILLLIGLSENIVSTALCSILGLWTLPAALLVAIKLVGIGVAGFFGLLAMFYAVANERPTLISIVLAFQVVVVFVCQYFLFDVQATWANAVGATLLAAACVGVSLSSGDDNSTTSRRSSSEDENDTTRDQQGEAELLLTEH